MGGWPGAKRMTQIMRLTLPQHVFTPLCHLVHTYSLLAGLLFKGYVFPKIIYHLSRYNSRDPAYLVGANLFIPPKEFTDFILLEKPTKNAIPQPLGHGTNLTSQFCFQDVLVFTPW